MRNLLFFLLFLYPGVAFSNLLPPDVTLVESYHSAGLYNLVGLDTWNGAPLGPGNMPNSSQRELDATISLYIRSAAKNELYVQVTDVVTTLGAYWFGAAFENVTQAGVRLEFPSLPGSASLNLDYANSGEILADGLSGSEVTTPLNSTPGYKLNQSAGAIDIVTINGAEYGFTSLTGIYGAQRIRGGGIFLLVFDPSIDVSTALDFSGEHIFSLYGRGGSNQSIEAFSEVPEPASSLLLGLACLAGAAWRRFDR